MRRISKPSVLAFSTSRRYLGVERTVSTPTVVGCDRGLEPGLYPLDRLQIGIVESKPLDVVNALRQDIRVDDPDRASERFDAGVLIGAALARTVRAGDEQEDGRLSV